MIIKTARNDYLVYLRLKFFLSGKNWTLDFIQKNSFNLHKKQIINYEANIDMK